MKMPPKKLLWIVLAAAVALCVVWECVPLPDAGRRLDAFPTNSLYAQGQDLPLNPDEQRIFAAARVIKRAYVVGGQQVMVFVVDGSKDRHAVHNPQYCFQGGGWEVSGMQDISIPGGEAKMVRLNKKDKEVDAVYWVSDGRTRHASSSQYLWQTALRRLTFGASGEEPLLVVVQSPEKGFRWNTFFERFPAIFEL
jgi:hypothetical protein